VVSVSAEGEIDEAWGQRTQDGQMIGDSILTLEPGKLPDLAR
jgi:hypothetical protein